MKDLTQTEQFKEVKQWIAEASHKVNDQMSKLGEEIKKYSVKGTQVASEVVEEHPLKSVGAALACGLIIGFLLGRK